MTSLSRRSPKRRSPSTRRPSDRKPTHVKVSSADDLLGLVPYLLGFHPAESLVLLLLRDGRVLLTARVDLPTPGDAAAVVDHLLRLTEQNAASAEVLIGYGARAEATRAVLEVAMQSFDTHRLLDAICVAEGRWWSLKGDHGRCLDEGNLYEVRAHPMAAEAVYAGLTAAVDRQQIEERVQGPAISEWDALEAEFGAELLRLDASDGTARHRRISAAVRAFLDSPRRLADAECAELALLAAQVEVRDVAWSLMTRHDIDLHVDLWTQVVSRTIAPWELAPLCLLGMAAWISGNGALQNCCADRARRADPAYSMTGLLDEINRRALPPTVWDLMGEEMRGLTDPLAR